MTTRSTRNKMRFQVQKAIDKCPKILEHLQYLDELAGGQSDYINTQLPFLVAGISELEKALVRFREGL